MAVSLTSKLLKCNGPIDHTGCNSHQHKIPSDRDHDSAWLVKLPIVQDRNASISIHVSEFDAEKS